MKRLLWAFVGMAVMTAGCAVIRSPTTGEEGEDTGYPGRWENAVLTSDEFGFEIIVIRQNDERWLLESKTTCFWARQYVGKSIYLKWGPVESLLMNDQGQICEFWTREQLN